MQINALSKTAKKLFSLFLAAVILFSTVSFSVLASNLSSADQEKVNDYKSEMAEYKKKIEEKKAEIAALKESKAPFETYAADLSVQIDNYQSQIDVLVADIASLESEKEGIQKQIDSLNKDISKLEDNITKNQIEQANVQSQIDDVYTEFKTRLCEIYVKGSTSDIELLLDCGADTDFSTYLIMLEMSQRRAKKDSEIIDTLNNAIKKIEELTNKYNAMIADIEVKKSEHQSKVDDLTVKEMSIEADKNDLESSQNELQLLKNEAFAKISELDQASASAQKLIDQYEKEVANIEKEIDDIIRANSSQGSPSANVVTKPGGFIWPLQYSDVYISSSYGYRYDPISGVYKLHGGTDTCCWSGTSGKQVVASADGRVIIATYAPGSYGYYVAIDHGGGIVTLYAHNSSLAVSVGQQVSQGQVIAYAGATGYVTGAHCHFEFRVNGNRVNAQNYTSP